MGRPLKIQKYSTNSGIGAPGAAVGIDIGFPNFGSLTNPVYNAPVQTLNSTEYIGVVGGVQSTATTTTNPIVRCRIYTVGNNAGQDEDGVILRQKGAHKYLVCGLASNAFDPVNMVVGQAYRIVAVGDTNWVTVGAGNNYAVGDIFTATAAAAAGTSGTVVDVGVCVLSDDATPASGFMSIAWMQEDSSELYISKLTNRFFLDWTGGSDYAASSVVADVRYISNFFTDEGTEIKSGTTGAANATGQQNLVNLAIVQNYTS